MVSCLLKCPQKGKHARQGCFPMWDETNQSVKRGTAFQARRRPAKASPSRPPPSSSAVAGSGTGTITPVTEKLDPPALLIMKLAVPGGIGGGMPGPGSDPTV